MVQTEEAASLERPEINLLIAVMRDAISLATRKTVPKHERKDQELAKEWLHGSYVANPGYSFDEMAENLGYNAGYLRRGVMGFLRTQGSKRKQLRGFFDRKSTNKMEER